MNLTAAVEAARLSVRLQVDAIPAGAATYTVMRAAPSGNTAGVRGATDATVTATTMIARDWEAPFDLQLVYTATAYDGAGAVLATATQTVTVSYGECPAWLVDLARPTNSLPVTIQEFQELSFDVPAGVHRVLDRRAPVLTTRPAYTPSAELVVLADTQAQRDHLRDLLGSGYPFLLRTDPAQGIGNMYLGLTQFIEERILSGGYQPERRFRVAVVQVERPDPAVFVPLAPNTYQHVKDTFASYADLHAQVGTYDQLAYTFPTDPDEGSALVPWLPDDI